MGEFRESVSRLFSRVDAAMKAAAKKREGYLGLRARFINHVVVPTLNEMRLEMQEHNRRLDFAVSAGQVGYDRIRGWNRVQFYHRHKGRHGGAFYHRTRDRGAEPAPLDTL